MYLGGAMRLIVRVAAVVLSGMTLFLLAGPYLPESWIVREWAVDLRQVMNAWWGFPAGLTPSP